MSSSSSGSPFPQDPGTYIRGLAHGFADLDDVAAVGIAARHGGATTPDGDPGLPVRFSRLPRQLLYPAWQRLGQPRAERTARGIELCHATTWAVPPTRLPLVVTVHDLAFLQRPEVFTAHGNAYFRRALDAVRDRAAILITPSHDTARACEQAGIEQGRLQVVPHGTDVSPVDSARVGQVVGRHGIRGPYVMWAGTIEPRKNVSTLLAAYALLATNPDVPDLVLVGPAGWGALPEIPEAVRARVHLTGHVPREELHALYAGASCFVFPSLAEGFGLPVLEAMAHGAPVVTSRGTACAEVAGDAALLVDPLDTEALAAAVLAALEDAAALGRAGIARAAQFTWAAAARSTADAYHRLVP